MHWLYVAHAHVFSISDHCAALADPCEISRYSTLYVFSRRVYSVGRTSRVRVKLFSGLQAALEGKWSIFFLSSGRFLKQKSFLDDPKNAIAP